MCTRVSFMSFYVYIYLYIPVVLYGFIYQLFLEIFAAGCCCCSCSRRCSRLPLCSSVPFQRLRANKSGLNIIQYMLRAPNCQVSCNILLLSTLKFIFCYAFPRRSFNLMQFLLLLKAFIRREYHSMAFMCRLSEETAYHSK